ncbi:MAG TPA: hypothetical protein ENN67_06815 [Firmicutes bacterium]|nr:hypothetical protein [Bacillota bacterium]
MKKLIIPSRHELNCITEASQVYSSIMSASSGSSSSTSGSSSSTISSSDSSSGSGGVIVKFTLPCAAINVGSP